MPDKSMTVASYAAGASLAAVTLIYVFAPTYFIDGEANTTKKKGIVGLANPANDCFINSVLQALSGLGDLRSYLIRETHRRTLDEHWVYENPAESKHTRGMPDWKIHLLQRGTVTKGLKDMLDSLNERPINKKTISASPFIRVLETAFRQRISRQQQDAQEFLQIVAERLSEEYHAGHHARIAARGKARPPNDNPPEILDPAASASSSSSSSPTSNPLITTSDSTATTLDGENYEDEEDGFPMEGSYKSQIECTTCRFRPKPKESTFCTITLNVPHGVSSTSLNTCFDGMFKKEDIDDWKCEKCRLVHAISEYEKLLLTPKTAQEVETIKHYIGLLGNAVEKDPETPPPGVELPQSRYAPARKIERHTYITRFPKILAVHLSRSIFGGNVSQKNSAKVAFPETLKLGTLEHGMKNYKLLAMVTHKGNHHSGHYESFRRQSAAAVPYSNPNTFYSGGVYSKMVSPTSTPNMNGIAKLPGVSPMASTPDLLAPEVGDSPTPSVASSSRDATTSASWQSRLTLKTRPGGETSSIKSVAASAKSTLSKLSRTGGYRSGGSGSESGPSPADEKTSAAGEATTGGVTSQPPPSVSIAGGLKMRKKKPRTDKWWRISDEKVKEARTNDVLGMQREVYLLFYEIDRSAGGEGSDALQ